MTHQLNGKLVLIGFHATPDGSTPESQNEIVASLLQDHGYSIRSCSARRQPLARLIDQLVMVIRSLRWADAVIVDAFSGRRAWTPFLVVRLARRVGVPSVLVLHGGGLPEYARTHSWRIDSTIRMATRVVAPSRYLKRAFEARGFPIVEVPNLIGPTPSSKQRREPDEVRSILWMRAFDSVYRPDLAIEAFADLSKRRSDVWLTMAGPDQGLLDNVRRLAQERHVQDRVSFPGYLSAEAKAAALRGHDLFLNTSQVDNTPVSVIEAMAAGLPVVAADVGGMSDLLEGGHAGLLVPNADAASLSSAMGRVLDDPDLCSRLSQSAAKAAIRFAPEAVIQAWQSLLEGVGVGVRVTD